MTIDIWKIIRQCSFVTFSTMKYNATIYQSILIAGVQPMVHFSAPTPLALDNHVQTALPCTQAPVDILQAALPSTEAPVKTMTGKRVKKSYK